VKVERVGAIRFLVNNIKLQEGRKGKKRNSKRQRKKSEAVNFPNVQINKLGHPYVGGYLGGQKK